MFDNDGTLWAEKPMYFQVLFALQNAPREALSLPELSMRPFGSGLGAAKFDLTLSLVEAETIAGGLEWNVDLFDDATAARSELQAFREENVPPPRQPGQYQRRPRSYGRCWQFCIGRAQIEGTRRGGSRIGRGRQPREGFGAEWGVEAHGGLGIGFHGKDDPSR